MRQVEPEHDPICRGRFARGGVLFFAAGVAALTAALHAFTPAGGVLKPVRKDPEPKAPATLTGSLAYPRWAVDSDGTRVVLQHPVRRIASQFWSIDELAYSLASPASVVAVSATAYREDVSNIAPLAARCRPAVVTDLESVLRVDPDLVLVSSSGRVDYTDLLRGAGVPVFRLFTNYTRLAEIREAIRLAGYLTGEDESAARVLARFDGDLARARARRPVRAPAPRILGYSGGYSYGSETLFDDIVRAIGGRNAAADNGLKGNVSAGAELVARWDPDWIFSAAAPGQEKQAEQRLRENPAIVLTSAAKLGHIVVLDNRVFFPMSPFSTRLVNAMAEAIYPAKEAR